MYSGPGASSWAAWGRASCVVVVMDVELTCIGHPEGHLLKGVGDPT